MAFLDRFRRKSIVGYAAGLPPDNPFVDLHALLCVKVREGRAMELRAGKEDWAAQKQWQAEVEAILYNDTGTWMPEIQELQILGNIYYDEPSPMKLRPLQVLARQIRSVETFIWRLHRKEVV